MKKAGFMPRLSIAQHAISLQRPFRYVPPLPGLSRIFLMSYYAIIHPVIPVQKVHLTSKPVALIEDLLAVTAPQASVLDPFMGGGSVGEACIRTGRGYVGMELSREYYDISRTRLTAVFAAKEQA